MSGKLLFAFAVSIGLVASYVSAAGSSHTAEPVARVMEWEHLAMPVDADRAFGDADVSRQIVRLGNEGWELVDVETVSLEGQPEKLVYFFKRPQ
jgi:hypothetical protein